MSDDVTLEDSDEKWLEGETEMEDAAGTAAAGLLNAFRESLKSAPPEKRFNIRLEVEEVDDD